MIPLSGFSLSEVGAPAQNRHRPRGAFLRAYLARSNAESLSWRRQFIHAFLERDLPQLGIGVPAPALLRFWTMVAHSQETCGTRRIRRARWGKRADRKALPGLAERTLSWCSSSSHGTREFEEAPVKSPKAYLRDSGLLHCSWVSVPRGICSRIRNAAHRGRVTRSKRRSRRRTDEAYFWATHQGAELDLLLIKDGRRLWVEIKRMDAPVLTLPCELRWMISSWNNSSCLPREDALFSLAERST